MSSTDSGEKFRGWMLTINNPTEKDNEDFWEHECKYKIYQFEEGKDGTLHIQGFIYYENPRVWPKKHFPRAHIEPARDIESCIKYCSKEDTRVENGGPHEDGERPKQGKRNDLHNAANLVLESKNFRELILTRPDIYCRYYKGLERMLDYMTEGREMKPVVVWIWGDTGKGKTKYVLDKHGKRNVYIKDGTKWWDRYDNYRHKVVLIDDYDGNWPFRDLLRLLDWNEYQGQTKGAYVQILADFIYITCDKTIEDCYSSFPEKELNQLKRRFDEVIHLE